MSSRHSSARRLAIATSTARWTPPSSALTCHRCAEKRRPAPSCCGLSASVRGRRQIDGSSVDFPHSERLSAEKTAEKTGIHPTYPNACTGFEFKIREPTKGFEPPTHALRKHC